MLRCRTAHYHHCNHPTHANAHTTTAPHQAYGQTSSGKTYTMAGAGEENPGVVQLAAEEIANLIEATEDREFILRVSYMEVSRAPG